MSDLNMYDARSILLDSTRDLMVALRTSIGRLMLWQLKGEQDNTERIRELSHDLLRLYDEADKLGFAASPTPEMLKLLVALVPSEKGDTEE